MILYVIQFATLILFLVLNSLFLEDIRNKKFKVAKLILSPCSLVIFFICTFVIERNMLLMG